MVSAHPPPPGQENGLRAGTHNTAALVGFAKAAQMSFDSLEANGGHGWTLEWWAWVEPVVGMGRAWDGGMGRSWNGLGSIAWKTVYFKSPRLVLIYF